MKKTMMAVALFGLLAGGPIAAQGGDSDQAESVLQTFSVAGLTIGLTPGDVREVMAKKGFEESQSSFFPGYGSNFAERISAARTGERAKRSAINILKFTKGDQSVIIGFEAFKSGNQLDTVAYGSPSLNNDCEAFLGTLTERYGADRNGYDTSRKWQDRDYVNGNYAPGTIVLKANCLGGKLNLYRFGTRAELSEAVKVEVGAVDRDF